MPTIPTMKWDIKARNHVTMMTLLRCMFNSYSRILCMLRSYAVQSQSISITDWSAEYSLPIISTLLSEFLACLSCRSERNAWCSSTSSSSSGNILFMALSGSWHSFLIPWAKTLCIIFRFVKYCLSVAINSASKTRDKNLATKCKTSWEVQSVDVIHTDEATRDR